jgi:hypothetical protein
LSTQAQDISGCATTDGDGIGRQSREDLTADSA